MLLSRACFGLLVIAYLSAGWYLVGGLVPLYVVPLGMFILVSLPGLRRIRFPMPLLAWLSGMLTYLCLTQLMAPISLGSAAFNAAWVNLVTGVALVLAAYMFGSLRADSISFTAKCYVLVQSVALGVGVVQTTTGQLFFLPSHYVTKQAFLHQPAGLSGMTFAFGINFLFLIAFGLASHLADRSSLLRSGRSRLLGRLALALGLAGIVVSQSRSGLLAALAGSMAVALCMPASRKVIKKSYPLLAGIALACYVLMTVVKPVSDTFGPYGVNVRFALWDAAINAIKASPVFGHGLGSSPAIIDHYIEDPLGIIDRMPHNVFLQLLIEIGILGSALLLGPAVLLSLALFRTARWINGGALDCATLFGVLVMFAVDSLFHNNMNDNFIWVAIGLSVAVLSASRREEKARAQSHNSVRDLFRARGAPATRFRSQI